jgi:histone acetyltransferase (RNA polymerase elongator complex component)
VRVLQPEEHHRPSNTGCTLDDPPEDNRVSRRQQPGQPAHVAFYGGSFTALRLKRRGNTSTLSNLHSNRSDCGIRLSTRPDCITSEILALLKEYRVTTIELGVQSMDDAVLTRSGRGHTATDTRKAVNLIRSSDFLIGLQLMPGLPGDSAESFRKTIDAVIGLKPDFVRIYPALVIKDTPLEDLYMSARYVPLSLDDAISLCREALERFELAGIDVIRIGLQPTEELEKNGTIIAGPYHPAFRQLVESSILLDKMRCAMRNCAGGTGRVTFQVNSKDLSAAIGQKRSNIKKLEKEFGGKKIRVVAGNNVQKRRDPVIVSTVN